MGVGDWGFWKRTAPQEDLSLQNKNAGETLPFIKLQEVRKYNSKNICLKYNSNTVWFTKIIILRESPVTVPTIKVHIYCSLKFCFSSLSNPKEE